MVSAGDRTSFTDVGPGTSASTWRRHAGWATGDPLSLEGVGKFVVVAAHPDDETLGAGGLMATATRREIEVELLCATDGEGSHPNSPVRTPEELAVIRAEEGRRAAQALGVGEEQVHRLSLPDGGVERHTSLLADQVVELTGSSERVVIVAPWRLDGHPDHEAAGHAAAVAARRTGSELWEYPVWFWHWGHPGDAPWFDLRPFPLGQDALRAKRHAIRAHASQVMPLSDHEDEHALLPPEFLEHFEDGPEHYLRTT
jgi:LmbE family N-acetylglucosaminyl deacetylase